MILFRDLTRMGLLSLILASLPARGAAAEESLTQPGGIVMFGDSTTALRLLVAKVYAKRILEVLQSSGSGLTVHNAGIGGNTTRDAKKRYEQDVLRHRPAILVMQFGINDSAVDVWKKPPATAPRVPLAEYETNLREMIGQAREQGIQVILMTTNPLRWTDKLKGLYGKPPYEPGDPLGFEEAVLPAYNAAVRKIAAEMKAPLVDVHAAYAATGRPAEEFLLDGIHPNDQGHALVADQLLPVIRTMLAGPEKQ